MMRPLAQQQLAGGDPREVSTACATASYDGMRDRLGASSVRETRRSGDGRPATINLGPESGRKAAPIDALVQEGGSRG